MRGLLHGRNFWLAIALAVAAANLISPTPEILSLTLVALCLLAALASPVAMLVVLLVLAPLRALIATESAINLPLDIGQILLLVYFAVWLAHRIAQRQAILILRRNIIFTALFCLCAVFALGSWTSASLSAWLREWLKWLLMAIFVWHFTISQDSRLSAALTQNFKPSHRRSGAVNKISNWRWLVFALLTAATANALVGLYIFFGGSGADHLMILGRFYRAFGSFGQPNPFAGFMGLMLPLAMMAAYSQVAAIVSVYQKRQAIYWHALGTFLCFGMAAALIASALLASWSRGAWLGTAVAAAVMLFALPKRATRGFAAAMGLALLMAGLWLAGLLPQSLVNRLTASAGDFLTMEDIRGVDISPQNYAVVERIAHWQAALNMAQSKPILGVGLGNYEIVYEQYRLINWRQPLGHAHNFYLNTLAETGILGLIAYLGFWLVIFLITWRARAHPDSFARAIIIALLGSWTYLAVHSIFDNLFVNNLFLHIGVLLGMLAILHQQLNYKLLLE